MKVDHERVSKLLTDTVTLLCKNGVSYDRDLKIQALIAVTIDGNDVFVVEVNETFPLASQTLTLPAESTQSTTPVQCESTAPSSKRRNRSEDIVDLTRLVETPALATIPKQPLVVQNTRQRFMPSAPMYNGSMRKSMPSRNIRGNYSMPPPKPTNKMNEKLMDPRNFPPEMMRAPQQFQPPIYNPLSTNPPTNRPQGPHFLECLENTVNQLDRNNPYPYLYPMVQNPNSSCKPYPQDMRSFLGVDSCQGSLQQIMEYENFSRRQEMLRYTDPFMQSHGPEMQHQNDYHHPILSSSAQNFSTNQKTNFLEPAPKKKKVPTATLR